MVGKVGNLPLRRHTLLLLGWSRRILLSWPDLVWHKPVVPADEKGVPIEVSACHLVGVGTLPIRWEHHTVH